MHSYQECVSPVRVLKNIHQRLLNESSARKVNLSSNHRTVCAGRYLILLVKSSTNIKHLILYVCRNITATLHKCCTQRMCVCMCIHACVTQSSHHSYISDNWVPWNKSLMLNSSKIHLLITAWGNSMVYTRS